MTKHHPPVLAGKAFNCIYCDVYAAQRWFGLLVRTSSSANAPGLAPVPDLTKCLCSQCGKSSFWYKDRMIIPAASTAPPPHTDLPDDCKSDYDEARSVVSLSPKAAAALMRLVIQKLMKKLGESGENINNDIKSLVAKGLPPLVQKALDFCRVVGNNAVHPGEINLDDTPEVAYQLFAMVNFIVQDRISRPKEIEAMFDSLPEGAKEAIAKRDTAAN